MKDISIKRDIQMDINQLNRAYAEQYNKDREGKVNPWQDLFNAWLETITPKTEKKMIRPYTVVFRTTAEIVVEVDAEDDDQAVEVASDMLDEADAEFSDWEVHSVDVEYDR